MNTFELHESGVRSYCRSFPVVFKQARGAELITREGKSYIDFLAGAGTLNYGHNHPVLKQALLDYIAADGLTHGLDMYSEAKETFLSTFDRLILKPRHMDYVMQFTGPTGTNAVEAALKLARKVTGRNNIISFTNGFHGCSIGALAATGNQHHRGAAGVPLTDVSRMPYADYFGDKVSTVAMMDKLLSDPSSSVDKPAAVIVEVVQGEGGLNAASADWVRKLEKLCRKHEMLLIVDDIQAGCGRTGTFFSFEEMGIKPDMITLSKSLSGYGLPFAMVLLRKELDQWNPGEHNGTFRGNNHAFVTAAAAIEHFWQDDAFANSVKAKGKRIADGMHKIVRRYGPDSLFVKGRGMMIGISCPDGDTAAAVCRHAFDNGLVIETSGAHSEVVKCLCPLIISEEQIDKAMNILDKAFAAVMSENKPPIKHRKEPKMIVRTLAECEQTNRKIKTETWDSTRMLLKDDKMGFSFHITTIYANTETHIHYQNHLESVYCISGNGEVETVADGKIYKIEPGTLYILDKHDEHLLRGGSEDMKMACVFNPPLNGKEVHDESGVYPLEAETLA